LIPFILYYLFYFD